MLPYDLQYELFLRLPREYIPDCLLQDMSFVKKWKVRNQVVEHISLSFIQTTRDSEYYFIYVCLLAEESLKPESITILREHNIIKLAIAKFKQGRMAIFRADPCHLQQDTINKCYPCSTTGIVTLYNKHNQILSIQPWFEGKRHSKWIYYWETPNIKSFDNSSNGEMVNSENKIKYTITFDRGIFCGPSTRHDEDGNIVDCIDYE